MTKTAIADAEGVGRKDVYTKVTERIISDLEQGIRPWMKPWSAEHAADASRNRYAITARRTVA